MKEITTSDIKAGFDAVVRDGIAEIDHFEATALNRIETYKRRYKRELVGLKMIVDAELAKLDSDHKETFEPSMGLGSSALNAVKLAESIRALNEIFD